MRRLSLGDWLKDQPFTLCMSSGFFGFFAHCGVLLALEEAGLAPARVRGSSAGALISGLWAAGLPAAAIAEELSQLTRADFWDPKPGIGLLRGGLFDRKLRSMLPVARFEQCRVPVSMSIFDLLAVRTKIVATGDLAPAIRASCALPGLFQPVWIDQRPHLDGGIADRSGLKLAPHAERTLYHHLLPSSPWRPKNGRSSMVPQRPNQATLAVEGLPKVNPFRLEAGRTALAMAHLRAAAALREDSETFVKNA